MTLNSLTSNDWPHFVYLVLLLAVLSSSIIFQSKLKASQLLKQAALWLIILLVVLVFYSFRYTFYGIKDRLAQELFPSRAVMVADHKISINISKNKHFYVNIKVNDQPIRFMIDTGASDIALSLKDARTIGFDTNNLSYTKMYQTANGTIYGANVYLKKVELAGLVFKDVTASVSNSDMETSLLGMSFLRKFKKYEFYQDRLVLTF